MIIIPEIFLAICAVLVLFISPFLKKDGYIKIGYITLIVIFLSQFFILKDIFYSQLIFDGFFIVDSFGSFLKSLILIGAGLIIFFYLTVQNPQSLRRPEFPIIFLLSVVGMLLMISSNNLLSLFMSMELQSLSLYILVSFSREDFISSEAGVKYFIIGSLSTCIFLFGTSLIYGLVGSTSFNEISLFMSDLYSTPTMLIVGLIFILVSLALKISAAPFHMWTPDVYQGAPSIVTTLLSTLPKIAAFGVLIRILVYPFGEIIVDWGKILIILSIVSMLIGSLGALLQTDLKRLMAYSTINHIGFILNMQREQISVTSTKDLSGLYKTQPLMAGCLSIILFSMAGIPPMAGFVGKLIILNIIIDNNLFYLAIIAVLTSVIAAFYYIRLIKSIFFDEPIDDLDNINNNHSKYMLCGFAFFNLTVVFYPQFFLNLCASITLSLFAVK